LAFVASVPSRPSWCAGKVEAGYGLGVLEGLGQEELERDLLIELEMVRRDDDAHATGPEDALDTVLSREDLARTHASLVVRVRHGQPSPPRSGQPDHHRPSLRYGQARGWATYRFLQANALALPWLSRASATLDDAFSRLPGRQDASIACRTYPSARQRAPLASATKCEPPAHARERGRRVGVAT